AVCLKSPDAWLLTVARNQQRDTWKSAAYRTAAPLDSIPACEAGTVDPFADIDPDRIPDRRLALLFACAHSAIDSSVHTPLMLQVVLGFEAAPIAAALGLPTTTLTKRLSRAKRRLREAGVPFQIPGRSAMAPRLPVVLGAIYGCFAMSWADAGSNFRESTESLVGEARHLAVTLATLLEDEPEAWGLAALITFSLSRAESRGAGYVPLEEQTRRVGIAASLPMPKQCWSKPPPIATWGDFRLRQQCKRYTLIGVAPELPTGTLWQHCPPRSSVSLRLWGRWSLPRRSSRAPRAQRLRSRSLSILLHGRQKLTRCRPSTPLPRKCSCK